MDPFRDELAAAHAKIAQLEERIRTLEAELQHQPQRQPEPTPLTIGRPVLAIVAAISACFATALVIVIYVVMTRGASSSSTTDFRGIATADPPNTSNAIPPTIDPRPVASSSSAKASGKPCNCTPGDPLCTCL